MAKKTRRKTETTDPILREWGKHLQAYCNGKVEIAEAENGHVAFTYRDGRTGSTTVGFIRDEGPKLAAAKAAAPFLGTRVEFLAPELFDETHLRVDQVAETIRQAGTDPELVRPTRPKDFPDDLNLEWGKDANLGDQPLREPKPIEIRTDDSNT